MSMDNFLDRTLKQAEAERKAQERVQELRRVVGFAARHVLPGESHEDFKWLLKDLRAEHEPEGPSQEDAVFTMAIAIWRKSHLGIFQRAAEARLIWDHCFGYPNDWGGFYRIMAAKAQGAAIAIQRAVRAREDAEKRKEENAKLAAGADKADVDSGAQAKPKSVTQRANATSRGSARTPHEEVALVRSKRYPALKLEDLAGTLEAEVKKHTYPTPEQLADAEEEMNQIMLAMMGDLLTPERYIAELRMIELLDKVIERSLNRLNKLKASQARTRAPRGVDPLIPDWRRENTFSP